MQQADSQHDGVTGGRGLTFPIKLRCGKVADLCAEPGLEDALARALGRAFATAQAALPAALAAGQGVVLNSPRLINPAQVDARDADQVLQRVRRAIEAAAHTRSLPLSLPGPAERRIEAKPKRSKSAGTTPDASERFDPERFDARGATYEIPSYDGGKTKVAATKDPKKRQPPASGDDAMRERLERVIDTLIGTIPAIVRPLAPAAPRETAQTNDEHTLDGLEPALVTLKGTLKSIEPGLVAALDTRLLSALEMASVLPDRILTIQQLIRALASKLPNTTDPSDEIVVLQRLRRRYLLAFASSPSTGDAFRDFNKAEDTFADLRDAVADVKFNRLSREFDTAREQVGRGRALKRSGGSPDPGSDGMWELLKGYTQAFVDTFAPHGPVQAIPASYESTVQLETDLGLYRILGAMFLQYSVALRYDEDVRDGDSSDDFKKHIHYRTWLLREQIARYWNQQDYQGYIGKVDGINQSLDDLGREIEEQAKRDADTRMAILLAATLVAGVAGILVRAALVGVLLETTAGATRLAIAVTVTEATAFTATELGLESAKFGKPITIAGAAKAWATNVAQFAAFSSLSKLLGPLGPEGRTWLSFAGRHAAGLVFQADISLLTLAVQGRDFPTDIRTFLIETVGAYAIGSTLGYIGQRTQNALVEAHKNEFAAVEGEIFRKFAEAAARTGRVDEATFNKTKADLLDHWSRVEEAATRLRDAGFMSTEEFQATQYIVRARRAALSSLHYPKTPPGGPRTYTGPLLLEPSKVPGLVKVGPAEIYRYDPQRPPARLGDLATSYKRISPGASLEVTFAKGTLVVREHGTGRLTLMIGPGPVPAGLLPPPPPHEPPHPLSFVESASGGPLPQDRLAGLTAAINKINRSAIAELQARGNSGMAALSLLIKYRVTLGAWPIDAVRGLGTALELPRAITKANIERFFARPSETAALFQTYHDVADMPGADIAFRLPATQRTVLVLDLYHDLRARGIKLPAGVNESALRGLLNMLQTLGREVAIEKIRDTPVDRRLALMTAADSTKVVTPPVAKAQLILDRHAGDVSPGINLADEKQSPAQVRAKIEGYAQAHGGGFDSHIPARIEAAIRDYQATLRRVRDGTETDSRNLDGTLEEFKALFLALDRGARILAFSRNLGAAKSDPFQVQIDVGWHPLRGRVTVRHAPKNLKVQLDLLAHTAAGLEIEEVTSAGLELPAPLRTLATTTTGAVTVDWSALNDTTVHRKWKQILKNIALVEFGEELARSWGVKTTPAQLTVRVRSATANAKQALANLNVHLQLTSGGPAGPGGGPPPPPAKSGPPSPPGAPAKPPAPPKPPPPAGGGPPAGHAPPPAASVTITPVSANMNITGQTAGTGGVTGISGLRARDGSQRISIDGRVLPSIARQGFERNLVRGSDVGLGDYDLLHLWGPRLGDEAAAGIWLGPKQINIGEQARIEAQLQGLATAAAARGGRLTLRVTGATHPRADLPASLRAHDFLAEVKYQFRVEIPGTPAASGEVTIRIGSPPNGRIELLGAASLDRLTKVP